jgi:AcrR family transcriptional regulator
MAVGDTKRDQSRARPGRPRSEESRIAVLRATSELMLEVGLRAMTTDEIASRSGASKATIYKWWPNKHAVAGFCKKRRGRLRKFRCLARDSQDMGLPQPMTWPAKIAGFIIKAKQAML